MISSASPELFEAVRARRQQMVLRLGIGAIMALTLGGLLGWAQVGVWLAVWYAVQLVEHRWALRAERRAALGQPMAMAPALALVFLANGVFSLLALAAVLDGNTWAMICGIWIMAGALLNAVAMSRASTPMFVVGAAPTAACCVAVEYVAWRQGANAAEVMAVAMGGVMVLAATLILRRLGLNALREAKQASLAKSVFLANMSHEIRTPLNGVLGMAQAMSLDDLPPAQRERLEIISRSGQALLSLLNEILDLSKIEAGKLELEPGAVDVAQVARDLCDAFQAACADKDVGVACAVEPEARGWWAGDPVRIRQVLSNLLSNAVKFTARGEIRLAATVEGGRLCLRVSDTGPGIEPDRLDSVFDKFVQADASTTRLYGGTGLGLSICRELVGLMQGELSVESELGKGTTFIVRLPLTRADAPVVEARAPAPAPEMAQGRAVRVLAAEDHKTNQAVLRVMLAQAGLDVHIVDNGQEALDAWAEGDWDVILMDGQMPVMDGITATQALRRREAETGRARTPIIALTANAMSHHVEEYLACGMDAFVAKPFDFHTLLSAIAEAVEGDGAGVEVRKAG